MVEGCAGLCYHCSMQGSATELLNKASPVLKEKKQWLLEMKKINIMNRLLRASSG